MDYRHENQQQRQQLLTIVDRGTAEQLFTFLQRFHRRPFQNVADVMVYEGVIDDEINFIDCTGTRYSVTPLIIAAGKGSYEKAKILLVHGANPNKQCATGDTALNLAVHRQKYPVVDLLLQYHANPNVYNQAGKTALHRAVILHNDESINLIRKLLAAGADPTIEDRNQRIPLDEAVIANRPEIVDVLLSHDQTLTQRAYRAAIIASRLGHDKCLEILINYGMDPNITDRTNTTPLHVAVRSLQLSTARLLIAKGANQNIVNNRGETAMDIARLLQADQQQNFINVLLHSPKIAPSDSYSYRAENAILQIYPLLRNHSNWTLDSDEFRSRTAQNSSVQNLLDTSSRTYWCCPQTENAWVIFDLKHQYNINGVRIIGCENQSTPKNGHIDVSNALNGPWLKVKDFTCLLTQGNKNDFFFPSLKTRFIRVFILDNYGAGDIQIQGISFFGVDMRLVDLLKEYNLENSLSTLLANGINDQETLIENQDEILNSSDKYLHVNDHFRFVHLTESLKSPQLTFLEWFNPPQTTVIAGEKLRTFSVAGNEGVTNRIKLEEKLENNPEATTVLMRDLEPIQGRSLVDFPDYIIKNPGRYKIRVVSIESSDIHTPWQEIVVGPTLSYPSRLNTEADEQLYLLSTTHLLENTTSDKESTLRSQKKSTTPTTRDNRAFIVKVYESENEDTEDDTYLLSLKSIEDSPYYFPFKNMSHTTDSGFVNYQRRPYKPEHYTQTKMVDYYDHSTNTDDDYEDSSNPSRLNYNLRPGIHLTPTKYRSESRTPLSNIFPNTNIRNGKQSDDYETLDFGDKIIIPTKYRLQQERIKRLLNDENINRSLQQSPIQIEEQSQYQQRQSQNQNEFNQELPQRQRARKRSGSEEGPLQHKQQQSHYHSRQQSRHQDGLARESSPEQDSHYYELDQSHKQSEFVRESPPQQHRSRYQQQQQQQQQFQRRTNSEESLPQQHQSKYHQREQLQNQNAQVQDSLSTPPKQQQSQYRQQEQPRQRSRSERESSPQQQQEADYYEIDQTQKPSDSVRGSPSQQQQSQYHQQEQLQNQNARVQDPLSTPPQQQQSQYHQREQLQNQNTPIQDSLSTPPQQQRLQYHQQEQLQNQNARVQDPLSTPPQQQQSQYHQREQLQNQNTRIQDLLSTPPQQQRLQYHQQEQSRQQIGSERESSPQQQQANYYEIDQSQKRSESTQESPPQQQQSQYHQQEQLQTHNARVQDSLPPQHQQQSHYQQREQSPQRSGSSRESSPERPQSGYYQPEQSQKRSESTRKSPPRQQQTQQRNDSRSETLPPQQKQQQSRKQNKSEQDSSHLPPYYAEVPQSGVESDEESKVTHQHQQQLSLEIINQDDLKPIYNRYQVISGDFELRESPSGDSSHTNGSKPAQMQLIFKATLQGPDVQKRAKDSIYELANNRSGTQSASNTNKQNNLNKTSYPTNLQSSIDADRRNQITTNLVSSQENEYQTGSNYTARLNPVSHIAQSPTSRTKPDDDNLSTIVNYPSFEPSSPPNQSIKRSIFDDHTSNQLEPSNITIYSANDDDLDDIRERSHSPSQNYTSSKYDKNPLKQTNDSSSVPLLSSPKSMPKSFEHKSKYFFGENVPNQLSDDNEDDETECETFGHNSQARSLINTTIGRNLNYPYTTNPQFSINNNNYSENLQFAQHIDVGTATGNSLTQQERRSSSSNQSTVEKTADSPHDSLTITSNKQIPPQGGYGALGIRVASPNYIFGNQNISTTASSRTGFQQQYPPDSDRYGPNSGSSIRQGQSKTRFDQDEDDDNQSHSEADDDNNNIDNDQEDDNDIQDPSHDDHDDPKYMNDDEDDGSHHSTPRQSEVDESFKNNPVRDISNLPPMQYPPMNVIPLSQPDIYDTKKKNKKGGLFGLFGKDKTKDVDKINRKSSKQKSNKKKEKSSYKEKT